MRNRTRASNPTLASIVVIPNQNDTSEPDYSKLCPPITKLGDLPSIDLSNCSLNTHSLVDPYRCYNVPADATSSNDNVRNNFFHEAASLNLGSTQETNQIAGSNNSSLDGGSASTTQVNSNLSPLIIDPINVAINSTSFHVNNVNVLGWNIRGLGKKTDNKELSLLYRNLNPDIIFLSETKRNKELAARRLKIFGYPCTFNVPSIGRSGGFLCHLHFIYGEPNSSLIQAFWESQCQLPPLPVDEPVFFIGDFNALLGSEDKNGGLEVDESDFLNLRNFYDTLDLHDPGFSGPRFTWSNMQQGPDLILERLDRCLINSTVEILFPKLCINNFPRDSSNHCPMHIGFNYEYICMPRPFHFMAMWIEDPTCRDIIANFWSVNVVGSPAYKLKDKLLNTKKGLRDWNKSSFGNIQNNISTTRKELVDSQTYSPTDCRVTSRLKARLEYLYNMEELYWKDKSREVWLLEGDKNSPYFHRVTLFRRKRKVISWIKNAAGTILTYKHSIENDNSILNSPLSEEEIKNVVIQMGGKKAPGPNGFTGLFYQKYWDIVGEVVVDMTQTCFRSGNVAKSFNHTNITLIPKVSLAELVSQYRPIGLCNFIYKIVSKTLDNRLNPFMNHIISQNQSAFVPKRSIFDNILLANEAIYAVNRHKKDIGIAAIKLDMSKAYDKLEWSFLEKVLIKIGLSNHWVKLIHQCISTVSYFVLLNGSPDGLINPERGLRQGDPLSPYLYIICSEALSSYIDVLTRKGLVEGIKVCKNASAMTHLLFADDSLLFSKATIEDFQIIKYSLISWILVIGTLEKNIWGTPTAFKALKIQTHMGILQAVDARISIWLHKLLSQAARTTLIKHIGQAIPLCQMSAFLIPKHRCRKMDSHLCKKAELNNLAMLARNAWKIIENPDFLLPSTLKARYFPRTDFLNVKCPANCSWTWKCLHKPFISWIVGDGQFIDHWCDKWIPSLGFVVPNPLVPPDPTIKVSYFISPITRSWDVDRLNTHFDDTSTKKIVTIPLSQGLRPSPCSALWKHIWKINVPYRIQVFTWKAAKNALPARTVLHTRMPMNPVDCDRYIDPSESIMHALVLCPFASCVWFLSSFCINTQAFSSKTFIDWMLFWNNLVFKNNKETYIAVLMRARAMLLTRKTSAFVSPLGPVSISDRWMPPHTIWIKCNIDGAYDVIFGKNGAGFVMWDFSKTASFCASIVFQMKSAEQAEARAIWAALKKVVEKKLTHLIIESDAQSLINQFSAGLFDGNSKTDVIFKDIQFFSSSLVACLFNFQPRTCNSVAHELALWDKTNNSAMYWSVSLIWLTLFVEGDH
ncbi:uncharacterized protein LOC113312538 [Papaver somniferum]|uniref:uncharacterized protein LOC113312538 n=1 Tax=Papaver somniferum TaxID=3469 RepID=UPI000E704403|nr:uncharacterized protein LOC113312538 [Papaver somniferum]